MEHRIIRGECRLKLLYMTCRGLVRRVPRVSKTCTCQMALIPSGGDLILDDPLRSVRTCSRDSANVAKVIVVKDVIAPAVPVLHAHLNEVLLVVAAEVVAVLEMAFNLAHLIAVPRGCVGAIPVAVIPGRIEQ